MTDDPSGNASSVNAPENKPADQVVPLGPACLMVFVIILLFVSVAMVIGAWMLMGNQSKFAVRALESQLVPWVEQSPLDPIDKEEILATLDTVGPLTRSVEDAAAAYMALQGEDTAD